MQTKGWPGRKRARKRWFRVKTRLREKVAGTGIIAIAGIGTINVSPRYKELVLGVRGSTAA